MLLLAPVDNGNNKRRIYARISVLQTNLCLFDLFSAIAAFLYLGHKQKQSPETADAEGGAAANQVIDALSRLRTQKHCCSIRCKSSFYAFLSWWWYQNLTKCDHRQAARQWSGLKIHEVQAQTAEQVSRVGFDVIMVILCLLLNSDSELIVTKALRGWLNIEATVFKPFSPQQRRFDIQIFLWSGDGVLSILWACSCLTWRRSKISTSCSSAAAASSWTV